MLLHDTVLTSTGRLGDIARFFRVPVACADEHRLRDILPLPVPNMEALQRWRSAAEHGQGPFASGSSGGRRRTRSLAAEAAVGVWFTLVITALNAEYMGKVPARLWQAVQRPSAAQAEALKVIKAKVARFCGNVSGFLLCLLVRLVPRASDDNRLRPRCCPATTTA